MSTTQNMICSVQWLEVASHRVRLLLGSELDGMTNGNIAIGSSTGVIAGGFGGTSTTANGGNSIAIGTAAALALGATRWEMIRYAVLPYARSGMVSAVMLGQSTIRSSPAGIANASPSAFGSGETSRA